MAAVTSRWLDWGLCACDVIVARSKRPVCDAVTAWRLGGESLFLTARCGSLLPRRPCVALTREGSYFICSNTHREASICVVVED